MILAAVQRPNTSSLMATHQNRGHRYKIVLHNELFRIDEVESSFFFLGVNFCLSIRRWRLYIRVSLQVLGMRLLGCRILSFHQKVFALDVVKQRTLTNAALASISLHTRRCRQNTASSTSLSRWIDVLWQWKRLPLLDASFTSWVFLTVRIRR